MPTNISIGFSSHPDTMSAFREAAIMAKNQSGQHKSQLALIAHTPNYLNENTSNTAAILEQVYKILNPDTVMGITSPSLILTESTENNGVAILSISSDDILFGTNVKTQVSLKPLHETSLQFARELANRMQDTKRLGAVIFADNLELNYHALSLGLQEGLGRAFIMGGGVCPGKIIYQKQADKDCLAGLIIGGLASFAVCAQHGWQPLGKPRIITQAANNLIKQIDNRPAIDLYKDYFPEHFANHDQLGDISLLYPLGLSTSVPREYIIKNPLSALSDGSLVCQGDIQPGIPVHLMIGDKDACRQATQKAALEVRDKLHGKHPKLVLIFASMARRKLFGRSARQEINQIKEIFGFACPVFGVYTYGEIVTTSAMQLQVNNSSMLIAALG